MASLESKLLDGGSAGYCSSSDEDETEWKTVSDEEQNKANVMQKIGPSVNTGVKGVLKQFAVHQRQAAERREADEKTLHELVRKGMLQSPMTQLEDIEMYDGDVESIDSLRERRLMELRKAAVGKILEIVDKEQFTNAIDTSEGLLCVLIYKPNDEMCDRATHACKVLAADYPCVKFVRAKSTLLQMSKNFTEHALPTLQFYSNGGLVGNFIRMPSLLGDEIDVVSIKKFLKEQGIDLNRGERIIDSEYSTDEEAD